MSRKPLRPLALSAAMLLTSALAAQSSIDAIHYKLELELLFNTRSIVGTQTATFASLVNGLKTLELDLDSSLTVNAVKDTSNNPLSYTRPTDKIVITLPKTYNVNEQFTVVVDYSGTPVKSSWGGGMVFTTSGGSPVCWTLSEPWDARMWWPGKDELDDKSTFEMWITHPDTMLAASNGLLQGIDTLSGNRHRSRWETKYPTIPYLISIAVGNYRKRVDTYTHMGANMPVEFYVYPASWTSWQSGMNAIVPMLTAFSDKFGQYPFVNEKYGLAQFTWGGGMEHQTITSQYSAAEWLSAHELGHQWWGDMITCGTWHDIWLNEGFATFCEALWEELKPGGSMALYHSYMAGRKPYRVDGTVYVYNPVSTSQIFSSTNVYRKGGWVVHMLRHTLGEKLFWQALADYRKAFTGKSATTADFVASISQTVGRDMSWFTDQWVMKNGAPTYNYAWQAVQSGGQHFVQLQLDQSQSYNNGATFTMPVDVRVTTSNGTETHVVWNDQRQDSFVIPVSAAASKVEIDPDSWILRASNRTMGFGRPFWAGSAKSADAASGVKLHLQQDLGGGFAQRPYLVLAGMSGTSPGLMLGSVTVPINYDALSGLGIAAANSAIFSGFLGQLDSLGRGESTFDLPAALARVVKGTTMSFSSLLVDQFDYATPAWNVELR